MKFSGHTKRPGGALCARSLCIQRVLLRDTMEEDAKQMGQTCIKASDGPPEGLRFHPDLHPEVFSLKIRKELRLPVIFSGLCGAVLCSVVALFHSVSLSVRLVEVLLLVSGLELVAVLPMWVIFAIKWWFLRRARSRAHQIWAADTEHARVQMHTYLAQRRQQEVVVARHYRRNKKRIFWLFVAMCTGGLLAVIVLQSGMGLGGVGGFVLTGVGLVEFVLLLYILLFEFQVMRDKNLLTSIKEERKLVGEVRRRLGNEALTGGLSLSSNEDDSGGRLSLRMDEPGGSEHHGERGRE